MNLNITMTNKSTQTLSLLSEIVSEVLGTKNINLTNDMTAKDVEGWDSLSHVQILHSCELRWGIRLSLEELSSLETIGDLVCIIDKSNT